MKHYQLCIILCSRKFSPVSPPALIGENFIHEFFLCVKDCIADMATFIALVKILSLKNYYNTKVAWLGENFWLYVVHVGMILNLPSSKVITKTGTL